MLLPLHQQVGGPGHDSVCKNNLSFQVSFAKHKALLNVLPSKNQVLHKTNYCKLTVIVTTSQGGQGIIIKKCIAKHTN